MNRCTVAIHFLKCKFNLTNLVSQNIEDYHINKFITLVSNLKILMHCVNIISHSVYN